MEHTTWNIQHTTYNIEHRTKKKKTDKHTNMKKRQKNTALERTTRAKTGRNIQKQHDKWKLQTNPVEWIKRQTEQDNENENKYRSLRGKS